MNMKVDLNNLLKQAQDIQSKMQSAQEELEKVEVTGEAGAGLIKIMMNGRHTVKSIWIDHPSLLKESKEFIEELLVAAFNDALQKVEVASRKKLTDLTAQIQTKFSDDTTEN
jgi:nucleoid-associated protein EbfC